jgi:hypothetical protein
MSLIKHGVVHAGRELDKKLNEDPVVRANRTGSTLGLLSAAGLAALALPVATPGLVTIVVLGGAAAVGTKVGAYVEEAFKPSSKKTEKNKK